MTDGVPLCVVQSRYAFLHGLCLCDHIHAEKGATVINVQSSSCVICLSWFNKQKTFL